MSPNTNRVLAIVPLWLLAAVILSGETRAQVKLFVDAGHGGPGAGSHL
jgi:hypothetical protein